MKYALEFCQSSNNGKKTVLWVIDAIMVFMILFCLIGTGTLHAEETTESGPSSFSYSVLLRGEGQWVDLSDTWLNPDNILEQRDERYEGYFLGSLRYRGLGGTAEAEFRFGYEYLAGEAVGGRFDDDDFSSAVNQLYYQTLSEPISMAVGRKKVRWGVGYSYSPTDLITQLRNPEDPSDRLNRIEGTDLFQISYTNGIGVIDLVYFPELDWDFNDSFVMKSRWGARWYQFYDPLDLSFVGMIDEDGEWAAGLNTSLTVGNALELHAEYLYTSENNRIYPEEGASSKQFLYPYTSSDDGVHEVLVGGQYTFDNNLNLTLEYLYRSAGYTDGEFKAYSANAAWLNEQYSSLVDNNPAISGLQWAAANLAAPQRNHYLFTRLYHPEVFQFVSFEMYSYVGLEDGSGLFVLTPTYKGLDSFDVYCRLVKFWGGKDTEFGLVPDDLSAIVGVSFYMGG